MQSVCSHCHKLFVRSALRANRTRAKGGKHVYCSRECWLAGRKVRCCDSKPKKRPCIPGTCFRCRSECPIDRRLCDSCRLRVKEWQQQRKLKRLAAGLCLSCTQPVSDGRRYCDHHRRLKNAATKRNNVKVKIEVFAAYGGCSCACCGESELRFLTIDHVNNDGAEHRRQLFGTSKQIGGSRLYRVLKKQGFPPGFQVLCFNCNVAKGFFGECPHQTAKRLAAEKMNDLSASAVNSSPLLVAQ